MLSTHNSKNLNRSPWLSAFSQNLHILYVMPTIWCLYAVEIWSKSHRKWLSSHYTSPEWIESQKRLVWLNGSNRQKNSVLWSYLGLQDNLSVVFVTSTLRLYTTLTYSMAGSGSTTTGSSLFVRHRTAFSFERWGAFNGIRSKSCVLMGYIS